MSEDLYVPMTTRDYLRLLRRRRALMLLALAVCVGAAVAYSLLATRVWEGRAELLVNSDAGARPSILAAAPVLGLLAEPSSLLGGADLATQIQIISSRPCLEQAYALMLHQPSLLRRVRDEGVSDETLEGLPELLAALPAVPSPATWTGEYERLHESLLVSGIEDSQVMEVRAECADRDLACDFINALVLSYLGRSLADARAVSRRSLRYIEDELVIAQQRLSDAEQALRGFARQAGTVELQAAAEQQIGLLTRLDEQVALAEARVRAQSALEGELARRLGEQPEHILASTVTARNPQIADLQRALSAAEADRVALLEDYQPTAEPVRAAAARADELRGQLADAAAEVVQSRDEQVNPVAQQLLQQALVAGGERLAAGESLSVLRRAVGRVEAQLAELPDEQVSLLQLQREVQLAEKIYLALKEKQQEYEITGKTRMPAADLVEQAIPADEPVRPKRVLNVAAGLVAGLLIGLMLVALAEHLDEAVGTPRRLADLLGAPVVAALGGPAWRALASGDLTAASPAADALRAALGHMRAAADGAPAAALLVCAAAENCASVVGAALARAAEADGLRVALVAAEAGPASAGGPAAELLNAPADQVRERLSALQADLVLILAPPGSRAVAAREVLSAGVPAWVIADLRRTMSADVAALAGLLDDLGAGVTGAIATGGDRCSSDYIPSHGSGRG